MNSSSLSPNIFDITRIERILKSINSKLETIESIMVVRDDEVCLLKHDVRDNRDRDTEI